MIKQTKKKYIYLLFFLCLFLNACSNQSTEQIPSGFKPYQETIENGTITPTLFIHGYKGTKNSFGGMIRRLEAQKKTKKELTLIVSPEGKIKATGQYRYRQTNPAIQVLFEDNKNDEWHQATWIQQVMIYLRDTYTIKKVNVVAHSMGGASLLRYLTTPEMAKNLPEINKFVGIAVPFNSFVELSAGETIEEVIDNGPKVKSQRYADYEAGINNITADMNVLIIAGDVEDGSFSDGVVPVSDAFSPISLFKKHGHPVEYKLYEGRGAQHSALHENDDVDEQVADFLWSK